MRKILPALIFGCLFIGGFSAQAQANKYGAIAYSPATGAHGYSYNYNSVAGAQRRAMGECASRGYGCRIAVNFRNACGALAVGPRGWGSGWGGTRQRAQLEALKSCGRHSAGCRIRVWSCTDR